MKFTIAGQTMVYVVFTIVWGIVTKTTEKEAEHYMLFNVIFGAAWSSIHWSFSYFYLELACLYTLTI